MGDMIDPDDLDTDTDGAPCRFLNRYTCDDCEESWEDHWSCGCDDECPKCGHDISPEESEDLLAPYYAANPDIPDPAAALGAVYERSNWYHAACHCCGRVEHIDLLDAKPDDAANPGGCDWSRLECIACYGPAFGGWSPSYTRRPDLVSICAELHGLYLGWRVMNWISERRAAFRFWQFKRKMARRIARMPFTISTKMGD